jgi:hypothetical protein
MYNRLNAAGREQSVQNVFVGWELLYDSAADAGTSLNESSGSTAFGAKMCPETMLIYAVLNDAIRSFQKQFAVDSPSVQRAAAEAGEWLFSDDDRALFSFVSLCDVLGLEPEFIRRRLRNMTGYPSSHSAVRQRSELFPHPRRLVGDEINRTKART